MARSLDVFTWGKKSSAGPQSANLPTGCRCRQIKSTHSLEIIIGSVSNSPMDNLNLLQRPTRRVELMERENNLPRSQGPRVFVFVCAELPSTEDTGEPLSSHSHADTYRLDSPSPLQNECLQRSTQYFSKGTIWPR